MTLAYLAQAAPSAAQKEPMPQANVVIYTTPWCPFCHRAKALLDQKGVSYEEVNVDGDFEKRRWLQQNTGQRTVPQTFINGAAVGGCNELYGLERAGKLDGLLGQPPG